MAEPTQNTYNEQQICDSGVTTYRLKCWIEAGSPGEVGVSTYLQLMQWIDKNGIPREPPK